MRVAEKEDRQGKGLPGGGGHHVDKQGQMKSRWAEDGGREQWWEHHE